MPMLTWGAWTLASYESPFNYFYKLHYTLALFLTNLCVMHVYWTAIFIRILTEYKKTGATEDLQRQFQPTTNKTQ